MTDRKFLRILAFVALFTAVFHFCFGVWYWRQWVKSEVKPSRPPLELQGEDYLRTFPSWGSPAERDSAAYNTAALSIMNSGVPRTQSGAIHMHAPVYCYFLAGCYEIGGVRLYPVAAAQALLAGLTCFLVGLAAGRITPSCRTTAMIIGALLYLINLRAAMYVGYSSPTILVVALTTLIIVVAGNSLNRLTTGIVVCAMALATFAQASFFVVAGGVALWLLLQFWCRRELPQLLGSVAILVVVALKIIVSTAGGSYDDLQQMSRGVGWYSNNPYYESMRLTSLWEDRLGPNPWTSWHASEQDQQRFESYAARAGNDRQRAFHLWVRENPGQYLKLCAVRLRTAVGPYTGQMSPRNRAISTLIWLLIFPAGIYGLWTLRKHSAAQLVVLAYAGYASLATLLTEDYYLRYRLPLEALLTVFAAVGYSRWLRPAFQKLKGSVDAK